MSEASIPHRVHLLGIGGIHMSAIARILLAWGHQVSGCDVKLSPLTERLRALGAIVHEGHDAAHLNDADLAVMRSGASVMGELPALSLPAVLVPYPYAGGHQRFNAHYLADAGAALVVEDNKLNGFLPLVGELLVDERRRAAMAEACRRLARPNAARDIARILMEVAR